ncbi:MAG TPA: hypothetical protein VFT16_03680 [Candidatus Saccharimonadales bacterium]|nr:hypothetical protein [Candidatus Saccharimonadales bacterium]
MVQVKLERFSGLKSPKQGRELSRLVRHNADWLGNTAYKDDVGRYGLGLGRAVCQVSRLAHASELFDPYLIRIKENGGPRQTIGVGTTLRRQSVINPTTGTLIEGTGVDYWLDRTAEKEVCALHMIIGEAMLNQAVQTVIDKDRPDRQIAVFATVEPDKLHQPVGFVAVMDKVEGEGHLCRHNGIDDSFDAIKAGRNLDVLLYERRFQGDPFARPEYY